MNAADINLLQEIVSIHKDNKYMCICCIESINKMQALVDKADSKSLVLITDKTFTLMEKMRKNLYAWTEALYKAKAKWEELQRMHANVNSNSDKRKICLSLRRQGNTQDDDIDDEPVTKPNANERKEPDKQCEDTSDSDSDITILNCQVDNAPVKAAEEDLAQQTDKQCEKEATDKLSRSSSFDFDMENGTNDIVEDERRQAQRNNDELLALLQMKTTENRSVLSKISVENTTCNGGNQDDDCRSIRSSDIDLSSDDSQSLIDDPFEDNWEPTDFESGTNSSYFESEKSKSTESDSESEEGTAYEEPNLNVKVLLKPIDKCSDDEIDRLCNLNSLNKRKCRKTLRKSKNLKRRRIKLLSTSSSSSSELSKSGGSTTPDLPLELMDVTREEVFVPEVNEDLNAEEVMAEFFCNRLSDDDESISLDSEFEEEETPERKTTKQTSTQDKIDSNKESIEVNSIEIKDEESEEDDLICVKKGDSAWKDDELLRKHLWTSSEEEESSDSNLEKPKRLKLDRSYNDTRTSLSKRIRISGETTVISDSDISDDDCTFVNEFTAEEVGTTRRRRNIRAIMTEDELDKATRKAKQEEDERIKRLEQLSQTMEVVLSQKHEFILDADVNTNQPLITVDNSLAKKLRPHQAVGVRFMWETCYETVAMLKSKPGTGCIIAHCMGLGKTRQVITLIHTLFIHENTNTHRVLIICPLSTVHNWQNEFAMIFAEADRYCIATCYFLIKEDLHEKVDIVEKWGRIGGVLVMGYEAFQGLTNEKLAHKFNQTVRQKVMEALVNPGPDLVVCDEAHLLKNGETRRNKALMKLKTKRRIALTGTPLQNNLMEYYYMVEFVKPHLLGTFSEYKNRFANPITNGQYFDSRPEDIKLMKKRTHVLTKLLKKTIDRVETKVLAEYLPEIVDYTIYVCLQPIQVELYQKYISMVRRKDESLTRTGFFQDFRITNFISLHPYVLHLYYSHVKKLKKVKEVETVNSNFDKDDNKAIERIDDGWYNELFPGDVENNLEYSAKLRIVMAVIDDSIRSGDKALIFAHHLVELDIIEYFLKKYGTQSRAHWQPNADYFRMDGTVKPDRRSQLCKDFNDNPNIKIFLVSHKVGGLGLNLTGANRVILIGSNYNPSHDTQSIYRAYRFGQNKKCYVYRLLAIGTMEEKIYQRCVVKLAMAGTVVDKLHFNRHYNSFDLKQMYEFNYDQYNEPPIPNVPKDTLLATLLQNKIGIWSYLEHNALLENNPDEELDDEDKKLAWEEFNNEQSLAKSTVLPNPAAIIGKPPNPVVLPGHSGGLLPGSQTKGVLTPMNSVLAQHGIVKNGVVPTPTTNREAWNQICVEPRPVRVYSDKLSNFADALKERNNNPDVVFVNETPAPTPSVQGEFNYALNKYV